MRLSLSLAALLLIGFTACAQESVVLDNFEQPDISHWTTSMSPEYYKGGTGNKGLAIVTDPQRGKVLSCDVRFVHANRSEVCFITRMLTTPISLPQLRTVSFWYKLTGPGLAPQGGFKVRLRTSNTQFTDYDVSPGGPPPVGKWQHCVIDVRRGGSVRNIWGKIFGSVKQITFRLDDIDNENSHFALLLDDLSYTMSAKVEATYQPATYHLHHEKHLNVLMIKQSAAGYYQLESTLTAVDPGMRLRSYPFRGLQFSMDMFGFPATLQPLLNTDLVVLVDVDPFVLTGQQASWLANLVYSGAGMIFFGGPNTLNASHDFKPSFVQCLPVTISKGHTPGGPPAAGNEHYLNTGFDPQGLGIVHNMQPLKLKPGARAAWSVRQEPLIIAGQFGQGRVVVVNTWPNANANNDFFTSPLYPGLLRRLVQWTTHREPAAYFTDLKLPPLTITGRQQVTLSAAGTKGEPALTVTGGDKQAVTVKPDGPGKFTLSCNPGLHSVTSADCRLSLPGGESMSFPLTVQSPLELQPVWAYFKQAFTPGFPMDFSAYFSRRDLPQLSAPGASTHVTWSAAGLTATVAGFSDPWIYSADGRAVVHNTLPLLEVKTATENGLLPAYSVTGVQPCGRTTGEKVGDGRLLQVSRQVAAQADGSVKITTQYKFLQQVKVNRLPLNLTFDVPTYAGSHYVNTDAAGKQEGQLPVMAGKQDRLLAGTGLDLTLNTPHGEVSVQCLEPNLQFQLRDLRRYNMNVYRLEIEAPYHDQVAAAGATYTISLLLRGPTPGGLPADMWAAATHGTLSAHLLDAAGHTVYSYPSQPVNGQVNFTATCPNLASGQYRLETELQAGGKPLVSASADCCVVDPLRRADFFPIITIIGEGGGGHDLTEAGLRKRVDDVIAHGFNTAAIGGLSVFGRGGRSLATNMKNRTEMEAYAQQRGMATIYEYEHFELVGRDAKTVPCVFNPAYPAALHARLEGEAQAARRVPRLISVKVIDEPVANTNNMDYCKYCRAEFEKRYGIPMKPFDQISADDSYARWAMADFIGYYVAHAYGQSHLLKQQAGGHFDLLLTYMSSGLGYGRPLSGQEDVVDWTREVDRADFDVYPYFYPASQKIRMVQAAWCMAYLRGVTSRLHKPWGFYVELDDRNWPYQKNPKEASAECAYEAILHGANYLNSFIHMAFGTGVGARPERWAWTGRELRKIRSLGPLLAHTSRRPAQVAFLYPSSQAAINNRGYPRPYTYAAVSSAFGQADVLDEEIARETGFHYPALILLGCDILHSDLVPRLTDFVSNGGLLILDQVPTHDQRGREIKLPFSFPAQAQADGQGFTFAECRVGKGRVLKLNFDPETAYKDAIENSHPAQAAAIRQCLLRALTSTGLHADAVVTDAPAQMEVGMRQAQDAALVTVVNHDPATDQGRVTIRHLPFKPAEYVVVGDVQPTGYTATLGGCSFEVKLPARQAIMVWLAPEKPAAIRLSAPTNATVGKQIAYTVSVVDAAGRPARGMQVLDITVKDPAGVSRPRYGGGRVATDGVCRVSETLAVNATPGRWTIEARCPLTGQVSRGEFVVRK